MPARFHFSRRHLLNILGANLLLSSCGQGSVQSRIQQALYTASEPLNRRVEQWLFSPQRLAQEFKPDQIEPESLLINTVEQVVPQLDPAAYRLNIYGQVKTPQQLSLSDIKALPYRSVTARHICVEGWSAIVQWGGVALAEILRHVEPDPSAHFVAFLSAPGIAIPGSDQLQPYYETWDLESCYHPQTLLAYEKNFQPLPVANGAPLRLSSPVKLGYKQIKWVTDIVLLPELPQGGQGYWEDQGYEWYAGL